MIQVVWEFIVKESAVSQFLRAYGPGGPWSRLFEGYPGFRGTTLLRDTENPRRFLTIDFWETVGHRKRMMVQAKAQYVDLDELLADLTEDEDEIGVFDSLTDTPILPRSTTRRGIRTGRRTKR